MFRLGITCFLLVLILSEIRTENVTKNDSITLINLYSLSNSTLRDGFEPFYTFANYFIDNVFYHVHTESNLTLEEYILNEYNKFRQDNFTQYQDEVFNIVKQVSNFSPSLVNFIIISLVLLIVLPIVGLITCSYRCCCRGKFNPFDRKYDMIKRKVYAFVLFVLLLVTLMATVILFFTNQNSLIALKKLPNVLNSTSNQIHDFSKQDVPIFFDKSVKILNNLGSESTGIFDHTIEQALNSSIKTATINEFLEFYETKMVPRIEKLSNAYKDLNKIPETIGGNGQTSSEAIEFNEKIKTIIPFKQAFSSKFKFFDEINMSEFKMDGLLTNLNENIKNTKKNFLDRVNIFSTELKKNADLFKKLIDERLTSLSQKINSNENNGYVKTAGFYYQYFYYFLLGVCIFVLSLFIFHALGLAGLCSRRQHNNYKQTCHRGVSANFLLAGTAFYFIFSFILVILCICMFTPGILLRNYCHSTQTFEIQNHPIAKKYLNDLFENGSAKDVILQCSHNSSSKVLNQRVESMIANEFDLTIPSVLEKLNRTISNIQIESIFDSLKRVESFSESVLNTLNDKETKDNLMRIDNLNISDNDFTLFNKTLGHELTKMIINETQSLKTFTSLLRDDQTEKVITEFTRQIKKVLDELNQENVKESLKSVLLQTLDTFTLPKVNELKQKKINEIVNALPSCKIISNIYDSFTLSVCSEFTDNFNTFWFTLYILILLFFVISFFSMCQADLYRKFYRYDELLDDEMNDEKDSGQFDLYRQKSGRANGGAIDAYEMKGYGQSSMKYSNRSPTSRNTRA